MRFFILAPFALLFLGGSVTHAQVWNTSSGGDWNTSTNWTTLTVPAVAGSSATFGPIATAAIPVSLSADVSVGSITFDNIVSTTTLYSIGTSGRTITFDNGGAGALLRVNANCTTTGVQTFVAGNTISITDAAGLTIDHNGAGRVDVAGSVLLNGRTITKTGTGAFRITSANTTMAGTILIQGGSFQFTNINSLGNSGTTAVTVSNGAELNVALASGGNLALGAVHIRGNGTTARGAILLTNAGFTWTTPITLDGDAGIGKNGSNSYNFKGGINIGGSTLTLWTGCGIGGNSSDPGISGTGNLVFNNIFDSSTTTFNTANNYSGTTNIAKGSLFVNDSGALGNSYTGTDTDSVTIGPGGQVQLNGTVAIGNKKLYIGGNGGSGPSLEGSGALNSWAGAITLTASCIIGNNGSNGVFNLTGGISLSSFTLNLQPNNLRTLNVTNIGINGTGGLIKSGPGLVVIGANSSFSGPVTFANAGAPFTGGTLQINAVSSGTGLITVSNTGTLAGVGSHAGSVIVGTTDSTSTGNIQPGTTAPGTLTVGSVQFQRTNAAWNSYTWMINSWTGSGYSVLQSTGTLSMPGGGSTDKFAIKITGLTAANAVGAVPGFNASLSRSWIIGSFTNNLTASGITPDLFTIDTSSFATNNPVSGGSFTLDTSTNNLILNYSPVPEPVWLLGVGAVLLGLVRKRKSSRFPY